MKKKLCLMIVFAVGLLFLFSCRSEKSYVNPDEPVWTKSDFAISEADEAAVTGKLVSVAPRTGYVTIEYTNDGKRKLTYGAPFYLEMLKDGAWYRAWTGLAFTLEGYELDPDTPKEVTVNPYLYGKLEKGHYRIVRDFMDGYQNTWYCAVEFDLK